MTPTRRPIPTARRLATLSLLSSLALAACVPAPRETPAPPEVPAAPAPAPVPAPTPAPAPPQPAPPSSGNWLDAPQTPGDWSYAGGVARFGEPGSEARLTLRCDRAAGAIEIARAGPAAGVTPMVIRTETMERGVSASPAAGAQPSVVARISARDPLLDAMAFSRGRFAVEAAGLPALYVPAWPEVTRVIEDCR